MTRPVPSSTSGVIGGALSRWPARDVTVDGEELVIGSYGESAPAVDLLGDFIELRRATPATIARFARRFGPLRDPYMDDRLVRQVKVLGGRLKPDPNLRRMLAGEHREPVTMWRAFAGDLYRLLASPDQSAPEVFAELSTLALDVADPDGPYVGLLTTGPWCHRSGPALIVRRVAVRDSGRPVTVRRAAGALASLWLALCPTQLSAHQTEAGLDLQLGPQNLLGALGVQFAQWLAMGHGVAICAGCGDAFSPSRQPTAGRKSWCAACKSEGRDAVDRKRRQRDR